MSADLIKLSETEATVESRRLFVEETKLIQCVDEVRSRRLFLYLHSSPPSFQISHEFCLETAKKVTDARKRVIEGLGKGFEKITKVQGQGLSMIVTKSSQGMGAS